MDLPSSQQSGSGIGDSSGSASTTRRRFVKTAAASAFGFQFVPSHVWGANSRIQLGGIGTGGKGKADISGAVAAGMHPTAIVDIVDVEKLESGKMASGSIKSRMKSITEARSKYPDAKFYTDYREMIADMGDKIDAVTVSTPDHHHFHASMLAMKAGKHVYCQKPLTHSIWEARTLTRVAAETGVKTQMGNQAHANDHMRRAVELIRAGILGEVKEVHTWTNRPIWPQGFEKAPEADPVPAGIDWEQWIGPAPWVDYSAKIAPFAWRGWWDYGTGALGDMACHIMDMPYWALDLGAPTTIRASENGGTEISAPINSNITYDFADKGVKLHWYDGQIGAQFQRDGWRFIPGEFNRPPESILEGVDYRKYGSVVVGERGKMYFARKSDWFVKPAHLFDGFASPEISVPRARNQDNYKEWVDAIEGKVERGQSDFAHSGPFTETVLLGCLAQRNPGDTLKWDAESMSVKDRPDLEKLIRRDYRAGWSIEA